MNELFLPAGLASQVLYNFSRQKNMQCLMLRSISGISGIVLDLRGDEKIRVNSFLQDEDRRQEEPPTREPELEVPQPLAVALTKRQLKRRRNTGADPAQNFTGSNHNSKKF